MSYIYVTEQGTTVTLKDNQMLLHPIEGEKKTVPLQLVEGLFIFGNINLTTPLIQELLKRDIPVTLLSTNGSFYGKIESTKQTNVIKQAIQFQVLNDSQFIMELSKKIISAKTANQLNILRRYNRDRMDKEVENSINFIITIKTSILKADTLEKIMGYEGIISKNYFKALGRIVPEDFYFNGRSKMPPKDPFNSLLSLGYTMLMYEIYNAIVAAGMNPYVGFFHQLKNHHPSLASDLMEEWRAVLIDALCLNLVNKNIIKIEEFQANHATGGIYIEKNALKKFIAKYEEKIRTKNMYLKDEEESEITYRKGITNQVQNYYRAIREKKPELYVPLLIK